MRSFLKILFGSCLGSLLALIVIGFIGFSVIVGAAASAGEQKPTVESNSILKINVDAAPELTGNKPLDSGFGFEFDTDLPLGIHDMVRAIDEAAEDDDIKGIYLNEMSQAGGITKLRQVREALTRFKASGKFIVTYAPSLQQSAYYLGSVADEVYVGPLGVVDFRGLGAEIPFYKNLLDRAGIKVRVFYAGDFKSATEPFRNTEISDSNRLQTRQYLNGLFDHMVQDIAASRGKSESEVRGWADNLAGWKEEAAVRAGVIDGIMTRSEVNARLRELVGFEDDEDLETIDVNDYFEARLKALKGGDDEIAVLFAEGGIIDGKSDLGQIGDKKYVKALEELAEDDDVKAVVLRVNSGGGSASSSENIWYAAEKLKETGKPFVVSMGAVAASGGYYIAAGADSIFAEPTTITGSIGVFMIFPQVDELMNKHLGINFDTVNTAAHANGFSPFRPLGQAEEDVLKERTVSIYETFMGRVAQGRDELDMDDVRKIAGGRVYTGVRAQEIGLVDRLGGLDEAIASAATLAGIELDDASIGQYPKIKTPIEQLLEDILGEDAIQNGMAEAAVREQLGDKHYEHFQLLRQMSRVHEPQCVLPVVVNF